MNLQALLGSYRNDNRVKQLAEGIALPDPQHFFIAGLTGSAVAMTAAAVWDRTAANHVFILRDREEAAYFQNDLESLTDALDIFYFPDSFKKSGDFSAMNNSHVMLRTEALLKLSGAGIHKKVLVTYPEAIFEKVVPPKVLAGSMIQVKSGDVLPVDALLEKLVSLGFERTDFVYEPGQFAMRGGILDIYSFGNEKPYRIELFGDEVDSIRIFDPETQLSERKLLQVTLLPNVETQTGQGEKASLFEFLPAHTVWWIKDPVWTKEILEQLEGKLKVFLQSGLKVMAGDDGEPVGISAGDFETADALFAAWQQVTTVEFGNPASIPGNNPDEREIFPGSAGANAQLSTLGPPKESATWRTQRSEGVRHLADTTLQRSPPPGGHNTQLFSPLPVLTANGQELTANHQLDFHTAVQPVFNRQFELLIKDLQQHARDNYAIFLFAENPKQLERLHAIFADLKAAISFYPIPVAISQGFIDRDLKLVCYTDHQLFQRYHKYRVRQAYSKNRALTLKALRELQPGDYVTHIDHGVGVYSGLQKIEINGKMQEAVRIVYKNNDLLYVNINSLHKISKYTGKEGAIPKVNKLGSDVWEKLKEKTRSRVKDIAKDLIKLYAARKAEKGFSHSPDTYLQTELEASFLYEDTPDQSKATADVKKDMEAPAPMDRLICGDVGFGKTEVAVRAAFKTVTDNKQAAILVPTTILAYQHYQTFSERLSDFPCTVDFINRFKSAKDKKETLEKLAAGKIDIIIGTHALLGKEVKFKDLGVLIVDEEQKFGVAAKEKLKQIRVNVDTLTLTATPIPRTLQFSLMGAHDLSIINTPPPNRQPIQTEVHAFNEELIRDAVYFEAERGGQVFFIHNRVQNIREMAGVIQGLCPDLHVAFAHGKMEGHLLEKVVLDFINRKFDVLVCTNIVESGVDIPNANTIIINNAHHFGLSDLHQLRGRVGRSNKKAFCYLLSPPMSSLPADSRKRLQTLEQHSDLGSGFQIAMRDLDIRGAGNMLGAEQSGFMAEIGFEMYHKILDEAIRELKQTEFRDLFKEQLDEKQDYVKDCTIDTDLEILIPDHYVESITERLSLYQQLDNLSTEEALQEFALELQDRFGPLPEQVKDLFTTIRCRKIAIGLGFEKLILKEETLRCYFISNPDSPYFESPVFRYILDYIQRQTNKARLKQAGKNFFLVVEDMENMDAIKGFLQGLTIPEKTVLH